MERESVTLTSNAATRSNTHKVAIRKCHLDLKRLQIPEKEILHVALNQGNISQGNLSLSIKSILR